MRRIKKAVVLIDWHNAEYLFKPEAVRQPSRYIPMIMLRLQQDIALALKYRDSTHRYRVIARVYHGWHCEDRPTNLRQEFEKAVAKETFARTIGNISFAPEIWFGNELACGSHRNPLYHTSREQGQKMVDTSITCDLLHMLKTGAANLGIIFSDDDDFIPAVFTAESWGHEAILLRSAGRTLEDVSKNLSINDIVSYRSAS